MTSLAPGVAYAQSAPSGKLDESLQQAVDAGCQGPQAVIIRTKPGYRQGLRDSLSAHGDVVSGEFASIDAVAATVHCDDLEVLASFDATATVSYDAPMSATGRVNRGRARGRSGRASTPREAVAKAAAARDRVAKAAAKKAARAAARKARRTAVQAAALREQEALAATTLQAPLFQTLLGQPSLRTSGSVPAIGVAVIDSGIQAGVDFGDRIAAFYDFTHGDIRAATPSDGYGHGTHVAGLIASQYVGVAPAARLERFPLRRSYSVAAMSGVIRAFV